MPEREGNSQDNDHEERLARLEAARREMEDALVIMGHLEAKSSDRIKEHAEFLAHHAKVIREIDDKLDALIDVVGKMHGGIESRNPAEVPNLVDQP